MRRPTSQQARRAPRGAVLVGIALVATPAVGDTFDWTGTDDSTWHNPLNWQPVGIPLSQDRAIANNVNGQEVLIALETSTEQLAQLSFSGTIADSRLSTNGHRLQVDAPDTSAMARVSGPRAFVLVFPTPDIAGFDADNLLVDNGANVTLFNDATLLVGQDMTLDAESTLTGSGIVWLLNEFALGATVGLLHGGITPSGGHLEIRALNGGKIDLARADLSVLSGGSNLMIDALLAGPIDGDARVFLGGSGHLRFTDTVDLRAEITFVGNGFIETSQLDLIGADIAVQNGAAVIDAITVVGNGTDVEVEPLNTLAFPQPVAFGAGSSYSINGTMTCETSATYSGGHFAGVGLLEQDGPMNVLAPTTIDMPLGEVQLGIETAPIDIDVLSGADLSITARMLQFDNGIWGSTTVTEAVMEVTTDEAWRINDELVLNSAILGGGPAIVAPGAAIRSIGFQDAIESPVTLDSTGELVVESSRLFVSDTLTLAGATIRGSGTVQLDGDLVAIEPESQQASHVLVDHVDWDGGAEAGHRTIVGEHAILRFVDVDSIESNIFDGYDGSILVMNNATLSVDLRGETEWDLDGRMTLETGTVSGDTVINRGRVEGNGTFGFTGLENRGLVAPGVPGGSAGRIFVRFNPYTQTVLGAMEIDLGGPVEGADHDLVEVSSGAAILGGALHIRLIDGFVPAIGEQFTIVKGAPIQGTFDEIIDRAGVVVNYNAATVVLTYVGGVSPADVNGDGVVNFADILAVLGAWGGCSLTEPCPEDIDGDGAVSFADLLLILAQWS